MILEEGWLKPILGFIILILMSLLLYIDFWKFRTVGKIIAFIFLFLSIPLKYRDVRERVSGEGVVEIETASHWSEETSISSLSSDVWHECTNYPTLNDLKVVIIDECKDYKGNLRKDTTEFHVLAEELNEYRTFKDELSFEKNCSKWNYRLFLWLNNRCSK
jgi:hypothetical protein